MDGSDSSAAIRIGVGALVIDVDSNILLLRRIGESTPIWTIPGGAVESNETVVQAINRELREETGLTPTNLHFSQSLELEIGARRWLSHIFIVDGFDGIPAIRNGEPFQEIAWFPKERLPTLDEIARRTLGAVMPTL